MGAVFRFSAVPGGWPQPAQPRPPAPAQADGQPASLRVSVVVATAGGLSQLMRCLQALLAQNVDPASYEILVVDQARDKATRRAVQALARTQPPHLLHYLRPLDRSGAAAAARNRGWRAARAPLVAFTDDSAVPDAAWLREGDQAMHAERWVALAGRVLAARPAHDAAGPGADSARDAQPLLLDSANLFVWRRALQAVGGFDDRFPDPAHEDADLQFRLQREGPIGSSNRVRVIQPPRGKGRIESLRWQHDRFFDALLYREHAAQYRGRGGRQRPHAQAAEAPPWGSYAVVALALAALVSLLAGSTGAAQLFAAACATGIVALAVRRLRRTAATPGRWLPVLASSALIPFLAVYWRLRGAWHYRVWFV